MIRKASAHCLLALAVAAFFMVGGLGNIFASEAIVADYGRWGYPAWFHYVTGTLELATAGLLARPRMRALGVMLGSAVMASAVLTVVLHGELTHAIAPLVVLLLTVMVGVGVEKGRFLPVLARHGKNSR